MRAGSRVVSSPPLHTLKHLRSTACTATTLIEITAFLERVSDTLENLELSSKFRTPLSLDRNLRMSPRHPDDVFKPPKERVTLPHLRTLALHRLTLDKRLFAALAYYNLIRMPGLETLQLDEIKGGLKAAIAFFGTREGISPLRTLKELHIWGKTTKNSLEDSLANMLRHLEGLEVLDQLKYDEDDGWLEALRGRSSEDDSDDDQDAPAQQPDLTETVCPNLRKLSLRRMEVDSRHLQDVVESRWDGGGTEFISFILKNAKGIY